MKTKIVVAAIAAVALLGFVKFCSQIAGAYRGEAPVGAVIVTKPSSIPHSPHSTWEAVQGGVFMGQEEPPHQPHTNDPAQCTRYCYPKGGGSRPKGTPEGIPGYECQGDACSHVNDTEFEGEVCHEGGGCTSFCSKVCCSCLAACI